MPERERESKLVEQYIELVGRVARRRFASRLPDDDLLQAGRIGLWEAARAWDGGKDFAGFARSCIYHNMLDYVRALGAKHDDTEELPENLEGGAEWDDLDNAELLEQIGRAWPVGSPEHTILSNLACGDDKRAVAARMGLKTYQVTRIAKRAVKRVQSGENR